MRKEGIAPKESKPINIRKMVPPMSEDSVDVSGEEAEELSFLSSFPSETGFVEAILCLHLGKDRFCGRSFLVAVRISELLFCTGS